MKLTVALGLQHIVVARNLIPARCSRLDISRWMISKYMLLDKRSTCFGVMPA